MLDRSHWQTLAAHAERVGRGPLPVDAARASEFALRVGPLYASFARQRLDAQARDALFAMAEAANLPAALKALFDGEHVNTSEGRAALHTALRGDLGQSTAAREARAVVLAAQARMDALQATLEASDVTDIVSVGIGGSDLGPRLAVDALRDFHAGRFRVHFLTNVDGSAAQHLLAGLDPARTAGILVSKSFGTQETLLNGALLRDWMGGAGRLFAVSANVPRAEAFGIPAERVLPMWDWVGGRYSLWSAVGFAVQLAIGRERFAQLLAGAALVDEHVLTAPPERNLAAWHALVAVWNRNGLGLATSAVLPYDQRLALLPDFLQQLVMESLGKSVRHDGSPVLADTVPVLWGGAGTNAQHSFFQALHQGTSAVPADFLGVVRPAHAHGHHHDVLLANLLAQAEALGTGWPSEDAHRGYPGGRPSTLLLLDELNPHSLGALLALYEHSVYVQSVLWGINAFDQWGVELGKRIAGELLPALSDAAVPAGDPVTRALLAEIRARR